MGNSEVAFVQNGLQVYLNMLLLHLSICQGMHLILKHSMEHMLYYKTLKDTKELAWSICCVNLFLFLYYKLKPYCKINENFIVQISSLKQTKK